MRLSTRRVVAAIAAAVVAGSIAVPVAAAPSDRTSSNTTAQALGASPMAPDGSRIDDYLDSPTWWVLYDKMLRDKWLSSNDANYAVAWLDITGYDDHFIDVLARAQDLRGARDRRAAALREIPAVVRHGTELKVLTAEELRRFMPRGSAQLPQDGRYLQVIARNKYPDRHSEHLVMNTLAWVATWVEGRGRHHHTMAEMRPTLDVLLDKNLATAASGKEARDALADLEGLDMNRVVHGFTTRAPCTNKCSKFASEFDFATDYVPGIRGSALVAEVLAESILRSIGERAPRVRALQEELAEDGTLGESERKDRESSLDQERTLVYEELAALIDLSAKVTNADRKLRARYEQGDDVEDEARSLGRATHTVTFDLAAALDAFDAARLDTTKSPNKNVRLSEGGRARPAYGIRKFSRTKTYKTADKMRRNSPGLFSGSPGTQGSPDAGLLDSLAASSENGGIDLRSMELRYLSETPESGMRYAFGGKAGGALNLEDGLDTARLASDSFFVSLAMPRQAFWVNLNPDEPDRVVDAEVGRTRIGKVMLEADLEMKRTVGRLIHPGTKKGKRFWDRIDGDCLSFRNWIVAGEAEVFDDGDELYIVDAPLEVRSEADYFESEGAGGIGSCTQTESQERKNEKLYADTVLPRLDKAVNHAPEYADLRKVYLARVAAEWYRQRAERGDTLAYGPLIDSRDVSPWAGTGKWKPRHVFDAYVESFEEGEFDIRHTWTEGNYRYEQFYVYGGVDWSAVPMRRLDEDELAREAPDVHAAVQDTRAGGTPPIQDALLVGGKATTPETSRDPWSDPLMMNLVLLGGALLWLLVTAGVVLVVLYLTLWRTKRPDTRRVR